MGLGDHRNAPQNVPSPFPPTAAGSMPLACCPSPAPVPVGTYPPGCWQSCPLSLLPPLLPAPHANCGPGVGEGHPVPWCQPGGPRPLGPTDKTQDPVLKRPRGSTRVRPAESPGGQPEEQLLKAPLPKVSPCHQAPASRHSPCPSICLGTKVPAIPESLNARNLRGSGVGLLFAL